MQIILEGLDCCYKTSVANLLAKELRYNIVKGSSFEIAKGTSENMFRHSLNILGEDNVIIDRFIHSNLVYATLFHYYTLLKPDQFMAIENLLWLTGDKKRLVVYLYAKPDIIKERLRERGDEYIEESNIDSIFNLYESVWKRSAIKPLKIDTSHITSNEVVEEILDYLF